MKIVLKQDVKNIGKAGDVKEVSPGYAKNYLFRSGLAALATAQTLKQAEQKKESTVRKTEKDKSAAEELFKKINKFKIKTKLKFGEGKTAFGSVSAQNIVDLLKEKGIEIDVKDVLLDSNIKTLGEHSIKVKLGFNFEPKISIIVEKE